MNYAFESMHPFLSINAGEDWIITMRIEPSWWARLWKKEPETVSFVGNCTVWNEHPSGERCDTEMEWTLHKIYTRELWKRQNVK